LRRREARMGTPSPRSRHPHWDVPAARRAVASTRSTVRLHLWGGSMTETFVIERLRAVRGTPRMWSFTRDAFAPQVALLLALGDAPQHQNSQCLLMSGTSGAHTALLTKEVDDAWAHALVDEAAVLAGLVL